MAKQKAKVGRPKLADTEDKKMSLLAVATVVIVAITIAIVGYTYLFK